MNGNFENNAFFQQLPEEIKAKLRSCRSEDEAMEILKGEMVPMPDDTLEEIAGGGCYSDCVMNIICSQQGQGSPEYRRM